MNLFRSVNVKIANVAQLVDHLTPLFTDLRFHAPNLAAGTTFFRTRIVHEQPTNISEVGVPPAHLVARPGRLNEAGQQVGYFSVSRRSAYFEVRPTVGDYVVLSRWRNTTDMAFLHIGYVPSVFSTLSSSKTGGEYEWALLTRSFSKRQRKIYDALSLELTKFVLPNEEWKYKTTIAIGKKFLNEGPHDGLLYPAVAMKGNADNLAVKITSMAKLKLYVVEFNRITKVVGKNIELDLLDSATVWDSTGKISWSGRRFNWNIGPGQAATARIVDGEWLLYDQHGNEMAPS